MIRSIVGYPVLLAAIILIGVGTAIASIFTLFGAALFLAAKRILGESRLKQIGLDGWDELWNRN